MESNNMVYKPFISPDDILYQYDEILIGNRANCSTLISSRENGNKYTDAILRYCFSKYLGWAPYDIVNCLTKEIVSQFKLAPFIEKRIPRPPEFDEWEYEYVGWYLYPDTCNLSNEDRVVKVYMEVVQNKRKRFPKAFFDETSGERRAFVCFRAMSNEFIQPTSIKQLYEMFGDEQQGKRLLNKYKLLVPVKSIFGTPLKFLHSTLENEWEEDEDLYDEYLARAKAKNESKELSLLSTNSLDEFDNTLEYEADSDDMDDESQDEGGDELENGNNEYDYEFGLSAESEPEDEGLGDLHSSDYFSEV